MKKLLLGFLIGYLSYACLEEYDYYTFCRNVNTCSEQGVNSPDCKNLKHLFSALHETILWRPNFGSDLLVKARNKK